MIRSDADLTGSTTALGLGGSGHFDATTSVFSADHLAVVLSD